LSNYSNTASATTMPAGAFTDGGVPSDLSVSTDLTGSVPDDGVPIDALFNDILDRNSDQAGPRDLSVHFAAPGADLASGSESDAGCSCDFSRSAPPLWSLLLVLGVALIRRRQVR